MKKLLFLDQDIVFQFIFTISGTAFEYELK